MLARMGSLLELKADKPKSEMLHNLKGMETARQAFLLMHVNMHCQTADQGPDGRKGTVENCDIPTSQETIEPALTPD